jgi:hypothetical protein
MADTQVSQIGGLLATASNVPVQVSQVSVLEMFGPLATKSALATQVAGLIARSAGDKNVTTEASQVAALVAYATNEPATSRQTSWTFVLDGHRFYVLPLGPEGTWAYDITTNEWCQLQTDGYDGLNFSSGVMWGLRIIGSDTLFPYLYEMDPNQPFDEEWRPIKHVATGGVPLRGRYSVGVANFTVTASVGDVSLPGEAISLSFSDDNGVTWSDELEITLTDAPSQKLIWNSLGSFSNPGRIFRVTDSAGPVRIDGADVVLTGGTGGADSGEDD